MKTCPLLSKCFNKDYNPHCSSETHVIMLPSKHRFLFNVIKVDDLIILCLDTCFHRSVRFVHVIKFSFNLTHSINILVNCLVSNCYMYTANLKAIDLLISALKMILDLPM